MTLLLDNRLAPITSTIIFFEAEVGNTVTAFLEWQIPIQNKRGVSFDQSHLQGNLEGMFKSLLPLTSVERRRFLFFPTRSAWTAFFDNGHQGTDASTYICKPLNCRALRITAVPHTKRDGKGRYGAVIFSLYGPESNGPTNLVRSVYAANDGGEWVFNATGTKQSFEQEDK
jgi:hypothetical protein